MAVVLYVLIGMLDVFAVLALSLKLYRLPLKAYLLPIAIFCLSSSAISYFIRVGLSLPWLDLTVLCILTIVFLRYVMSIKLFYSALIAGAGLNAYIVLQFIVMAGFLTIGGSGESLMYQSQGIEIQAVQVVSILLACIIAAALKMFGYGFSFIPIPPHDFLIKDDLFKYKALNISAAIALVVVALSLLVLFNVSALLVFPSILISFGLSYYFSNRRDLTID
ncbi:hypothetical protein D3C75_461910 [compost metagenome]